MDPRHSQFFTWQQKEMQHAQFEEESIGSYCMCSLIHKYHWLWRTNPSLILFVRFVVYYQSELLYLAMSPSSDDKQRTEIVWTESTKKSTPGYCLWWCDSIGMKYWYDLCLTNRQKRPPQYQKEYRRNFLLIPSHYHYSSTTNIPPSQLVSNTHSTATRRCAWSIVPKHQSNSATMLAADSFTALVNTNLATTIRWRCQRL